MGFFDPFNIQAAHGRPIILQDSIGRLTRLFPIEGGGDFTPPAVAAGDSVATVKGVQTLENKTLLTLTVPKTIAGAGGDQTINKPAGQVIFSDGTPVVVTNNLVTGTSLIYLTQVTPDPDMKNAYISSQGAGTFTISCDVEPGTSGVKVNFLIIN